MLVVGPACLRSESTTGKANSREKGNTDTQDDNNSQLRLISTRQSQVSVYFLKHCLMLQRQRSKQNCCNIPQLQYSQNTFSRSYVVMLGGTLNWLDMIWADALSSCFSCLGGGCQLVHSFNNAPYRGDTGHAAGMLKYRALLHLQTT